MSEYKVNLYASTKKPTVLSTIDVDDWFNMIRHSDSTAKIIEAREKGGKNYESVKLFSVPCCTYNFSFNKYKNNSNISSSTGLLYIDIDAPDFNPKVIDRSSVFAIYKSFGNNGYGIVVKVDGLTLGNFTDTYLYISESLGIREYIDLNAMKATQYNALSYDPDIIVNYNSKIYKSIVTPLFETKEEREAYSTSGGVNANTVRFSNKDEFDVDGQDVSVNWEGFSVVEAKVLFKKVSSNRNNILLSYCNNLVWLNPKIYRDRLFSILNSVNHHNFNNPLPVDNVNRIIDSILKYNKEKKLKPKYNKTTRKILFNTTHNHLNKNEKLAIVRKIVCEKRKEDSKNKLYLIVTEWDFEKLGRISQAKIIKNQPISKKTVEKYYFGVKDIIEKINANYLLNSL